VEWGWHGPHGAAWGGINLQDPPADSGHWVPESGHCSCLGIRHPATSKTQEEVLLWPLALSAFRGSSPSKERLRKRRNGRKTQRPWPLETTQGVGQGRNTGSSTRADGACTCICSHGIWAEQTCRLTCQAPATCTERTQRSWRWRRSGSPATEPSGPATKLDPLDYLQPIPAAHWTHGGLGGVKFCPLTSLFAQQLCG
jgi:hypothetical protein